MQPQRKAGRKVAPAGCDGGLSRDDVQHILGTFKEDGHVTKKGTFETIMDIYDRMGFQGGAYQSPIDPAPGFDPDAE